MKIGRLGYLVLLMYLIFLWGGPYSVYNPLLFTVHIFHHIVMTLFLGGWVIRRLQRGEGIPQSPLNLPLYVMLGVWALSAATSQDPRMSFENLWLGIVHLLLFWFFVAQIQKSEQRSTFEFLFIIGLIIALSSFAEVASWLFGMGWVPGTNIAWTVTGMLPNASTLHRPQMMMGSTNLVAAFSASLAILTLGWAWTTKARDYRIVLTVVSGLLALIVFLTFSRGGWLSLGIGLALLAGFWARRSPAVTQRIHPRLIAAGMIASVTVLLGLALLFTYLTDTGRRDMWRSAVEITADYPATGIGLGMYGRMLRDYRDSGIEREHLGAHNLVLNHTSETGLIGLAVLAWVFVSFGRATWQNWKSSRNPGHRRRIEICLAALVGMGFHSMGEIFYFATSSAVLGMILAAYCMTPLPAHRLEPRPAGQRLPAWGFLVALAAYSVFLFASDLAQSSFMTGLRATDYDEAVAAMDEAIRLDPSMRLYALQRAHFLALQAMSDPARYDAAEIQLAATALEESLTLEPSWSLGWFNLAALREVLGDLPGALEALSEARRIDLYGPPNVHWGRVAEAGALASDAEIVAAYDDYLEKVPPLAEFWSATPLRRQALENSLNKLATEPDPGERSLEMQYRILRTRDLARAAALVPENPLTADEWWVLGQHALNSSNDRAAALEAFTRAIQRMPYRGDYYVSRASALWQDDPAAAELDLQRAEVIGTDFEFANTVRMQITLASTDDQEERMAALESGYPLRAVGQSFPVILFRRPANFDVLMPMRPIGPGRTALEPWYTLAQEYESLGDTENARRMYLLIYRHAPDEEDALNALRRLED